MKLLHRQKVHTTNVGDKCRILFIWLKNRFSNCLKKKSSINYLLSWNTYILIFEIEWVHYRIVCVSAQYVAGLKLTSGDMPVGVLSGGKVGALQGHWSPLWAPLLTASALMLHLQVAAYHHPDRGTRLGESETDRGMSLWASFDSKIIKDVLTTDPWQILWTSSHLGWDTHWPWHTGISMTVVQLSTVMLKLDTSGAQLWLPGVEGSTVFSWRFTGDCFGVCLFVGLLVGKIMKTDFQQTWWREKPARMQIKERIQHFLTPTFFNYVLWRIKWYF